MNNKLLIFIIGIFLISLVSAELDEFNVLYGEKDKSVLIYNQCSSTTYGNLSQIIYPNNTIAVGESVMTLVGSNYNYIFNFTDSMGDYKVSGHCDEFGIDVPWGYTLRINPSGSPFSQSMGLQTLLANILILSVTILFFYIAKTSEHIVKKTTFYSLSIIGMIILILYTIIIIQQTLYGFPAIVEGIENFWFVIKMLLTVGIVVAIVYLFLVMLKMWKIKRGLDDD